ncbi:hypothetical protein BF49_4567 [Bradyrhizobium sp.]|nr:hypothetical protein BF49_4567 [Bradyrhizobium sp.]
MSNHPANWRFPTRQQMQKLASSTRDRPENLASAGRRTGRRAPAGILAGTPG